MALVGHVESAVREYTLLLAGRTIPPEHSEPLGYGELLVTHVDDQTVAVKVHHQNGILLLVVVGPQDVAVEAVGRSELLKEKNVTTPVVLLHGRAHPFVGIAGKVVLGTLELGPAGVVLLTAWAGQFHFLLLPASGGEAKVIRSGSMRSMRAEYDIMPWLAGATGDSLPRRGFEEDVQRAHARMVQGAPEPSEPGRPTLTSVVRAGLRYVKELCQTWRLPQRDQAAAAKRKRGAGDAAEQKPADRKRERAIARGRQRARILLEVLLAGGLFGLGDLIGPTSELLATLTTVAPGLRLTLRGLSDALRFLEEIAGFLVSRASPRTWWIHLRDLVNPESRVHKMLCKMTPGRFQLFDEPDPEGRILAAVAAKRAQMDRSSAAASAPSPGNSTGPAAASASSPSPAPAATPSPPATVAAASPQAPAPRASVTAASSSAPAVLAAMSTSAPTVATSALSSAAASPPPPVPPATLVVPPPAPPAASPAPPAASHAASPAPPAAVSSTASPAALAPGPAVATSAPSSAASPSPAPPAAVSPAASPAPPVAVSPTASPAALAPGPSEATSAPSSAAASPSPAPPAAVSPAASPVALAPAAAFATRTSPGLLRPPLRTELLAYLDIEFPPTCMPAVQLVIEQARQHLRVLAEMLREGAIVPSESEVLDVLERVGRAARRMVELELAASASSVAAASLVEPTAPPEPRSPRGDHS